MLVAPLNWGLGHATRCIPIINSLIDCGYEPVLASDGVALALLQKEFPKLTSVELPSYNITYAKKGKYFKLKLLKDSPKLLKAIKAEKKITKQFIKQYNISGIISDNRMGVYSKKIPCVFMTHQLNVLSGKTTWLSTKMHQQIIKKFNMCWVPDTNQYVNLSGKLGHAQTYEIPTKYIGPLSRFKKQSIEIINDILVLISGPEPQRTLLERVLFNELKYYNGRVVFVKGVIEKQQVIKETENMIIYNFMTSDLLEKTINESALIISRSGYTTIMDLAKLNKQAFFIPTPGQFEQEYLAERLTKLNLTPSCHQNEFKLEKLDSVSSFKGLKAFNYDVDFKELFCLFKGK